MESNNGTFHVDQLISYNDRVYRIIGVESIDEDSLGLVLDDNSGRGAVRVTAQDVILIKPEVMMLQWQRQREHYAKEHEAVVTEFDALRGNLASLFLLMLDMPAVRSRLNDIIISSINDGDVRDELFDNTTFRDAVKDIVGDELDNIDIEVNVNNRHRR